MTFSISIDVSQVAAAMQGVENVVNSMSRSKFKAAAVRELILVAGEDFKIYTDMVASERNLHHVYEWDEVGDPGGRLYELDIFGVNQHGGNMSYSFKPSTKAVPVGGANPQDTRTAQHIFYGKAWVSEKGGTFTISPQTAEVLAWPEGDAMTFRPMRVVTNNRFKNKFEQHWNTYWGGRLVQISEEKIARRVESRLAAQAEKHLKQNIAANSIPGRPRGIGRVNIMGRRIKGQADARMEDVFDL